MVTATNGLQTEREGPAAPSAETAVGWAAITAAAGAVIAWAACCVVPMSLALAGVGLGGFSWIAGQRSWLTWAAFGVVALGWFLTWRRARMCRVAGACAPPSRLSIGLLGAGTLLIGLALVWQPMIEPWAMRLIMSARG